MTTTKAWVCGVCGYVHEGDAPPDKCPVCGVDADLFSERAPVEAPGAVSDGSILIVGAGIAGITAAETARGTAPGASITVVNAEPGPPYVSLNRTLFLAGDMDEPSLAMKKPAWFEENRIGLVHGDVVDLGLADHRALLGDGRALPYGRLVLACGASPSLPPIPGAARRGVFALRTLEDARAILSRVQRGSRVVCVGGG